MRRAEDAGKGSGRQGKWEAGEMGGRAVFGAGLSWRGSGGQGVVSGCGGVIDVETHHLDPFQKGLVTQLLQRAAGSKVTPISGAARCTLTRVPTWDLSEGLF